MSFQSPGWLWALVLLVPLDDNAELPLGIPFHRLGMAKKGRVGGR